jgi:hypothetical protein
MGSDFFTFNTSWWSEKHFFTLQRVSERGVDN